MERKNILLTSIFSFFISFFYISDYLLHAGPASSKEKAEVYEVSPRRCYGNQYGASSEKPNKNYFIDLYTADCSGKARVFNKNKIVKYNREKMTLGEARSLWDNEQKSPKEEKLHSFLKRMEEYAVWVEENREELDKWAAENMDPSGPIKAKDPEQIALNWMINSDLDEMIPYHGVMMPRRNAKFLNHAEYLYSQKKSDENYKEQRRQIEIDKRNEIERKRQKPEIKHQEMKEDDNLFEDPPEDSGYSSHDPAIFYESKAYFYRYADENQFRTEYSSIYNTTYTSSIPPSASHTCMTYWLTSDQARKMAEDIKNGVYSSRYRPSLRKCGRYF